jgi:hypothetical protein
MSLNYTEQQINCVRTIQRAWRRYVVNRSRCVRVTNEFVRSCSCSCQDIQVFRFYRDLIHFHRNGDPQILMRTINPTESKYIDVAAGIAIRFRLAGSHFPPSIYYKLFTNRPVQDLGANAPRDYTRPCIKLKLAVDSNNKLERFPVQGR